MQLDAPHETKKERTSIRSINGVRVIIRKPERRSVIDPRVIVILVGI